MAQHTEYDLILMSLVIFVPTLFALVLLFFPRRGEEYMRWWALLGTAVTLVLSLWMFIDYYAMLDHDLDKESAKRAVWRPGAGTSLASRADKAADLAGKGDPRLSDDWVSRWPWIARFNIDY